MKKVIERKINEKGQENLSEILELAKNLDAETLNQLLALSKAKKLEVAALKKKKNRNMGKECRPLEKEEYYKIINLISNGFTYYDIDGKEKKFRGNTDVALALMIQGNLGLRISDVVRLRVFHLQRDSLEITEKKTNKLQYKKLNSNLKEIVLEYAEKNKLKYDDYIISVSRRYIQKVVLLTARHLGWSNIGTHSFRKFYAMHVYNSTKDIELVRSMLNHSDVGVTQKYLRLNQSKIDEVSASVDFTNVMKDKI